MKKKYNFVFIFYFLLLVGCSTLQKVPVEVSENVFLDKNNPPLEISFPFQVYLKDQESHRDCPKGGVCIDYDKYFLSTNKYNTTAVILKQSLGTHGHGAYFTGTDDTSIENEFYTKKVKNGFCTVYEDTFNGQEYFVGKLNHYRGRKYLNSISIYKKLDWSLKTSSRNEKINSPILKDYIANTKFICNQFLDL